MRLATCSCSRRCCLTLMSRSYSLGHSSAPCPIQATSHTRDMSVFGYAVMRCRCAQVLRSRGVTTALTTSASAAAFADPWPSVDNAAELRYRFHWHL
jgi:hypothetical protein